MAGDLVVSEEAIKEQTLNLPITALCNEGRTVVAYQIGTRAPDRAVKLFEGCLALVSGNTLAGFLVRGF